MMREAGASEQGNIVSRTTPESVSLSLAEFLKLLRSIEGEIGDEPALSTYYAKIDELQQVERQERVG